MTTPATRLLLRDLADELGIDTTQATKLLRDACATHAGRLPRTPFGPSTVIGQSLAARVRHLDRRSHAANNHQSTADHNPSATSETPPPATTVTPVVGTLFQAPGSRPVPNIVQIPAATPPTATVDLNAAAAAMPETPDYGPQWVRRGFDAAEQDAWIGAGLRPTEAVLADHCRSAGIEPQHLDRRLLGQSALSRLRGGEPPTSVWARIQEGQDRGRGPGRLQGRFA